MSLLNRIIKFFDKIDCPALYILKTPRAGEEVDNGYGVEFDLPPYFVIFSGEIEDEKMTKLKKLYHFREKNNVEIQHFSIENVSSVDEFLKELYDMDRYKIVWQRKQEPQ